ncbi:hypothetical protein Pmi06nite_63980 [Planotetraspora mira]|uniref:Mutator family transposase n=1 Tax=Planotetraspora mira TaxID=58121 RepID=A0A8J3TVQ2_9ACTN|nr:hypothetical protein Pmi06nite_63980 [Planotetraspora mira]
MAVNDSVDPGAWLARQIEAGDPDLLRSMVKTMAEALMSAEADSVCGADYGQRSSERTNSRNGYRTREWDTRAGTVELAIPKLRQGSYFPDCCWNADGGPNRHWSASWPPPTCWVSPPGGWTSWSSNSASPASPKARSLRWPKPSTCRWRRSAPARWTAARMRLSGWMR